MNAPVRAFPITGGPPAAGPPRPRPRAGTRPTAAPPGRLVRSELELALLRPRTVVVLLTAAVVPVLATAGLAGGPEQLAHTLGVLVVALSEPAALPLGMLVVLVAADGFAAERRSGTLDGLRLSPVGPGRLVALKASAVLAAAVLAAVVVVGTAVLAGAPVLGTGPYGTGSTLGRAVLLAGWVAAQLAGLGMLLLALSAAGRRPAVVVAAGLAALTVAPFVTVVWGAAAPVLPTGHWHEVLAAVTAVPVATTAPWATTARAAGFTIAGAGLAVFALTRRAC